MEKRHFLALLVLFLAFNAFLTAQTGEYTPYVSQVQVEVRNNLIRLTWVDSPDARGPVYIFRSVRPFGDFVPANLRPIEVKYGEQYFVDDTDDMENLYYFIAASDVSGQRFDIILPRINSISLIPGQDDSDQNMLAGSDLNNLTDGIVNLRATHDGEKVVITFETTGSRRNAILYRSTQPIRSPGDLLHAVIVQQRVVSPFADYPVPGFAWYYFVIYEDEISSGNMGIRPGVNATISPVIISGTQTTERSLRPIPLPVLTLNDSRDDGFFITEIPGDTALSRESSNILRNTDIPPKVPLVYKRPRAYVIDLTAPAGGEESALFQIVTEYFVKFEWENARDNLLHFLSSPRTREIEARTRFYLGQTFYFTGSYREALMEFLTFRSFNSEEANKWIEAILTAMVY